MEKVPLESSKTLNIPYNMGNLKFFGSTFFERKVEGLAPYPTRNFLERKFLDFKELKKGEFFDYCLVKIEQFISINYF